MPDLPDNAQARLEKAILEFDVAAVGDALEDGADPQALPSDAIATRFTPEVDAPLTLLTRLAVDARIGDWTRWAEAETRPLADIVGKCIRAAYNRRDYKLPLATPSALYTGPSGANTAIDVMLPILATRLRKAEQSGAEQPLLHLSLFFTGLTQVEWEAFTPALEGVMLRALWPVVRDGMRSNAYCALALLRALLLPGIELSPAFVFAARVLEHALPSGQAAILVDAAASARTDFSCSLLKGLLDQGFDVNQRNQDGATALLVAAERGRVDLIDLLIAAGADIDATDNRGHDAPHYLKWFLEAFDAQASAQVQQCINRLLARRARREMGELLAQSGVTALDS